MEGQPLEALLSEVRGRLTAVEETLQQFQQLAWALLVLASRSPVYLDVDHMAVERLDFHVGQVDVGELSGEMNIGLTSIFKPSGARPQGGEGAPAPAAVPLPPEHAPMAEAADRPAEALPTAPIWPPSGGDAVDQQRQPPDAGPGEPGASDEPGAAGPPAGGPGAGR